MLCSAARSLPCKGAAKEPVADRRYSNGRRCILNNYPGEIMSDKERTEVDRRTFVKQAGCALVAVSAAGMTARSYARIIGANDRIRLAQLGCGGRSEGHVHM